MSTQVEKIVRRALRLLRVLDPSEAPEAQQMENAIDALNQWVANIEGLNIAIGWQPVSNPADAMPTAPELDRAIAANLACELRPEYGVTLDPDVVQMAENGLAFMRQQVMANTYARTTSDLPAAEATNCGHPSAFFNGI